MTNKMRSFKSGSSRNSDIGKLDYHGFLSPAVLKRYAEYMHKNRQLEDGTMRDSSNWKLGIPKEQYIKSMFRHFVSVWEKHDNKEDNQEDLCALMFNVMGYLYEDLK